MPIPTPPPAPNPLEPDFAPKAYAFTQWMSTAAPAFDAAADRANAKSEAADQAASEAVEARDDAATARGQAQGFAAAAGEARELAAAAQAGAESARDSAAATYQGFDKRFLGDKAIPPTMDNQGAPLAVGALYYSTTQQSMRVWSGTAWEAAYLPAGAYQEKLVSGTNIKTVNGQDILGSGNAVAVADIVQVAKTAAYTAVAADKGLLLECSGTWTLGFAAAATLGAGWWCYVRNVGSGTITADPTGAELIDGVASGPIRPGMTLLMQCDGSNFRCIRVGPAVVIEELLTGTSGVVPLGVRVMRVLVAGGGGPGVGGSYYGSGGGGGGVVEALIAVTPGTSYTYTVGAAGSQSTFAYGVVTLISLPGGGASGITPGVGGLGSGGIVRQGVNGGTSQYNGGTGLGGCSLLGYGRGGNGTTNNISAVAGTAGGINLEY